ncbi:helix-turn-helix transcriptional regulator [Megalodesulfovibrio paquesii]
MHRLDRLLALILYLQSRRAATAEDMARHFGLSVRTIYRDMRALGEAGVPLAAEAGVGYALVKGYHLPPVNFTAAEAGALATSRMLLQRAADPTLLAHMDAALMKIDAVLSPASRLQLERLLHGLGTAAALPSPPQADLALLQQALAQRQVLRFLYQGYGKTTASVRTVEPHGLLFYLDRWHLIAWCRERQAYRDFRTDRMRNLELLDERFPPREGFSSLAYIRDQMPAPALRAVVRFSAASTDRARREWWLGIEGEHPASADHMDLVLKAVDWDQLAAWLLSFGPGATVLDPPQLRQRIIAHAEAAAAHHRLP